MGKKLASIPLFVAGCFLFYFGAGMLFLVPGDIGENYLRSLIATRFLYGTLPFVASLGVFVGVGWLWNRPGDSSHLRTLIKRALWTSLAAAGLLWVSLMIVALLHQ
jgi:hypothetical protein